MSEQKFEISGEIEGGENPKKKSGATTRFLLLLLMVVVMGSVWYFPFLQDEFPALKRITMGTNAVTAEDTTLLNQIYFHQQTIDSLHRVNDSLRSANEIFSEQSNDYTGLYYEVQIGAFNHFDIAKYQQQMVALRGETNTDGITKLTLGKFRDLKIAKDFLLDVREMGFKDAWIVAKENGQRVPFDNEVLDRDLP